MYGLPHPPPLTSYIESVKKDLEYPGSKKAKRDEEYWHAKLQMPEPLVEDVIGTGRRIQLRKKLNRPDLRWCQLPSKDGSGATITYDLDVDSTNKIIQFAEEHDIPTSVVILHAIRTVLSKFNNNEKDITIRNFVSRRSTLLNKKCGGVRMHCLPLRTIIEPTATVLESMNIINKEQQEMFLHADYSTMKFYYEQMLAYNTEPGAEYHSISFTYQPATRKSLVPYLKDIPYKSRWYSSGKQPQPFYITAMHRPGDGGLTFYFGYQKDSATPEEIEFLYYFTGRVLFRSIENPDKTIEEIIKMT